MFYWFYSDVRMIFKKKSESLLTLFYIYLSFTPEVLLVPRTCANYHHAESGFFQMFFGAPDFLSFVLATRLFPFTQFYVRTRLRIRTYPTMVLSLPLTFSLSPSIFAKMVNKVQFRYSSTTFFSPPPICNYSYSPCLILSIFFSLKYIFLNLYIINDASFFLSLSLSFPHPVFLFAIRIFQPFHFLLRQFGYLGWRKAGPIAIANKDRGLSSAWSKQKNT